MTRVGMVLRHADGPERSSGVIQEEMVLGYLELLRG